MAYLKCVDTPTIDSPPGRSWNRSLADRKLWLLKRSGLFGNDTKGARIERACTLEDLRKAYQLVHDVYLGTGYISAEPAGMRLRVFEATSETATFVAKVGDRIVGVLSVVDDSPELGLPSDSAFKEELDALRSVGMVLGEVTNQAVADEYRKSAVPTELMRCAIAHGIKGNYDAAVASVSPSHNGFYELLGFRERGSQRSYSDKLHDPVISLLADMNQWRIPSPSLNPTEQFILHFLTEGNPYLPAVENWTTQAKRQFFNADLLAQLFVAERAFLAECSPGELQVLKRRWGEDLFTAVTGGLFIPSTEQMVEEILHPQASNLSPNS